MYGPNPESSKGSVVNHWQMCKIVETSVCTYAMYVCMYVCMYMYACVHVCMYVCTYVCMYVRMYVCTCTCIYTKVSHREGLIGRACCRQMRAWVPTTSRAPETSLLSKEALLNKLGRPCCGVTYQDPNPAAWLSACLPVCRHGSLSVSACAYVCFFLVLLVPNSG